MSTTATQRIGSDVGFAAFQNALQLLGSLGHLHQRRGRIIGRNGDDFGPALVNRATWAASNFRGRQGTIVGNDGLQVGVDGRGYGVGPGVTRRASTAGIFVIV